jgi:hypothetical protein
LRNNELVQGAGVETYRILEQVRASSTTLSAALSCGRGHARLNRAALGVRRARAPTNQHLAPELEQQQSNQRREDLRDNEDAKHRPQKIA